MIENTFSIFPGIGPRIETYLWRIGVLTWRDFLDRKRVPGFSPARKAALDLEVRHAACALRNENFFHFIRLLGPGGCWRIWGRLSGSALCLDIETDGRRAGEGIVTVVGFYSHGEYRPYIAGKNLTEDAIQEELDQAGLLVTYFGAGFDIPYLRQTFPRLNLDIPHLDLCPAGHKAGLKGGLKSIEKELGISRVEEVVGLSGYEAVLLWQSYLKGADDALDTLVSYNREDTVNLYAIAGMIYERLKNESGLPGHLAQNGLLVKETLG
jgi:uncharacterized protein